MLWCLCYDLLWDMFWWVLVGMCLCDMWFCMSVGVMLIVVIFVMVDYFL